MRDALTGQYFIPVRNVLTEDIELPDHTVIRVAFEDGEFSGITVYVPNYLGKDFKSVRGALGYLMRKGVTAGDRVEGMIDVAALKLADRVRNGEVPAEYRDQEMRRVGNEAVNLAIAAEYDAKGIEYTRWGGAVVQVLGKDENNFTVLRFYNGRTTAVNDNSLATQAD